jgi:iron complex transport system permease protein
MRGARLWAGAILSLALLILVLVLSLTLGTRQVPFGAVLEALFSPQSTGTDEMVVRDLRVPRTLIGLAVGAALALAGTLLQGVTRNPLADPGLLGINAGASLFVVLGITWFGVTSASGYIWFALAGAGAAGVLVYAIGAGRSGANAAVRLAITGTAVAAAVTSLVTLVLLTNLDALNQYRFWSVGSLVGRDLTALAALLPFLVLGAVLALVVARMLNLLALGDDIARGLGQNVVATRVLAGAAVVLLCGSATALAGPLVFVGLVVPHIARRITGPDYRWMTVYAVLLGPVLVVSADVIGRLIVPPGELEAGLVIAFIGAPVMIALVRRARLSGL